MTVRVNDKRRFEPDGTPRPDVPPEPATSSSEPQSPPGDATPSGAADSEVAQLRAELDAARRRVDELARGIQEVMRDRDEFKTRVTRERERLLEVERGQVALAIVEAVDELDLSLNAADDSPLARGVRLIRDSLLKKLQASGVERLDLVGRPYDPNAAEAVDMELVATPEQSERVLAESRAAYAMKGRVIRPGRVKVGKYVEPVKA